MFNKLTSTKKSTPKLIAKLKNTSKMYPLVPSFPPWKPVRQQTKNISVPVKKPVPQRDISMTPQGLRKYLLTLSTREDLPINRVPLTINSEGKNRS